MQQVCNNIRRAFIFIARIFQPFLASSNPTVVEVLEVSAAVLNPEALPCKYLSTHSQRCRAPKYLIYREYPQQQQCRTPKYCEKYRCTWYHAACKVEFQPFNRSYSQLTCFNFCKILREVFVHIPEIPRVLTVFAVTSKYLKYSSIQDPHWL